MADRSIQASDLHSNQDDVSIPVRFSTGNSALDQVLGGGLLRSSLNILSGPPGAGKTILAQQISFTAAASRLKTIYFTNVSEPHSKLIEHILRFGFYRPGIIGDRIQIYNITSQIRSRGFRETLEFIVKIVRDEKADLVVIDSFRGFKHILKMNSSDRVAIFDLSAQLALLNCTTLLIGEYTVHEIQTDPEFAIADGIIQLDHTLEGMQARRILRIIKLRGSDYLGGEHSFRIDHSGFQVFPRQESLTQALSYQTTTERLSIGIPALDDMLHGGVIRSSSTLIFGAAGSGKTLLALHYLAAGAACGEPGLMVSFQENPEQLALRAHQFGLTDINDLHSQISILFLSPVELDLNFAAAQIRAAAESRHIRRIAIDSVAELEHATRDPERFDDFLASLVGYLRERAITLVMTREIPQIFGTELTITSRGLSYIVDTIVLLRYIEINTEIRRAIAVLKSRGSNHDKRLHELLIGDGHIEIDQSFTGMVGLLTGIPRGQIG